MGDSAELVNIRHLLQAQVNTFFAVAAAAAVTANTPQDFLCYGLPAGSGGDANAIDVPDGGVRLGYAAGIITTGSAAPVDVGWQLFQAINGIGVVTPFITTRLTPTSLTSGQIAAKIDSPFRRLTGIGTQGQIVVRVTANVDIASFQPFVYFTTNAARRLTQPVLP